jgi:Ulp1 protease family, C-terminal catalytic domain
MRWYDARRKIDEKLPTVAIMKCCFLSMLCPGARRSTTTGGDPTRGKVINVSDSPAPENITGQSSQGTKEANLANLGPGHIALDNFNFENLRKWMTARSQFFAMDRIYIPVNFPLHWSVVLIIFRSDSEDYPSQTVLYYDSKLECCRHEHDNLKKAIFRLLRCIAEERDIPFKESDWKWVVVRNAPQQGQTNNCGVFAYMYVSLTLSDLPLRVVDRNDVDTYIRKAMAVALYRRKTTRNRC